MMENEKRKIAFILNRVGQGGVEAMALNLAKHIDSNRYSFDFYVRNESLMLSKKIVENLGGRLFFAPPLTRPLKYLRFMKKSFTNERYFIVHSHISSLSFFPLMAARLAKVPYRIAHSHTTGSWKEPLRNLVKCFLRPFTKAVANVFVACSDKAALWLFGKRSRKMVTIIDNGVDPSLFRFDPSIREEVKREIGASEKFVVGHIGRMVSQKNHEFLLDVFAACLKARPSSKFIMIGEGPLEKRVNDKIINLGIKDAVLWVKATNKANRYYQAMDCFILPSLYEGLPVVAIEAQASGLPLLLSDSITKECCLLSTTKYLSLGDGALAWANALEALPISNEERIVNSKAFLNSRFSIQTQADKLRLLYDSLYSGGQK